MDPNADEPSRKPVPTSNATRLSQTGIHRDGENRTGEPIAVAPPIEPPFRHFAESHSDLV